MWSLQEFGKCGVYKNVVNVEIYENVVNVEFTRMG